MGQTDMLGDAREQHKMTVKRVSGLLMVWLVLALSAMACGPAPTPVPTSTPPPSRTPTVTSTPTPTATPTPSSPCDVIIVDEQVEMNRYSFRLVNLGTKERVILELLVDWCPDAGSLLSVMIGGSPLFGRLPASPPGIGLYGGDVAIPPGQPGVLVEMVFEGDLERSLQEQWPGWGLTFQDYCTIWSGQRGCPAPTATPTPVPVTPLPPLQGEWATFTEEHGLASNSVRAIAVAPDGAVWFGTWDAGVSRYDGQIWTTYTAEDGLADNNVWSIAVAPDGALWFGTWESGVSRFVPSD